MHFKCLLSKPYGTELDFSNSKKVKREAFALKIAIYNQNSDMLKLLINGLSDDHSIDQMSQIWNVAHVVEALN